MAPKSMLKFAKDLGWEMEKGGKHYVLYHPETKQKAILPYGTHFSPETERRITKQLRKLSSLQFS
jgi:hypothetical protein